MRVLGGGEVVSADTGGMYTRAPRQGYGRAVQVSDEWDALGVSGLHGLALDRAGVDPLEYVQWAALGLTAAQVVLWARTFAGPDEARRYVQAGFTDPWVADKWEYYLGSHIEAGTAKALADLEVAAENAPGLLEDVADELRVWNPTALLIMPGVIPDPEITAFWSRACEQAAILFAGIEQFTAAQAVLCALAGLGLGEVRAMTGEGVDWDRIRLMVGLRVAPLTE